MASLAEGPGRDRHRHRVRRGGFGRVDRIGREAYGFGVTVAQIIEEIGALAREDQCRIVHFAYRLDAERRLTGGELSALAERMAGCVDPAEGLRLREQIVRGFYGSDPHA